jgi:HAMP domain-containing protein
VQRIMLLVGLALVVLLAVIASLVTRWVVVPVRQAASGAQRLRAGSLDERMEVRGADELAALATSFNDMAASLQEKMQQLEDLTQAAPPGSAADQAAAARFLPRISPPEARPSASPPTPLSHPDLSRLRPGPGAADPWRWPSAGPGRRLSSFASRLSGGIQRWAGLRERSSAIRNTPHIPGQTAGVRDFRHRAGPVAAAHRQPALPCSASPCRRSRCLLLPLCERRTVRVAPKERMWLVPQMLAAWRDREGGAASNAAAAVLGAIAHAAAVSRCLYRRRH